MKMENIGFIIILSTFLLLFATLLPYSSASTTRRFHFNVSNFRRLIIILLTPTIYFYDLITIIIRTNHTGFVYPYKHLYQPYYTIFYRGYYAYVMVSFSVWYDIIIFVSLCVLGFLGRMEEGNSIVPHEETFNGERTISRAVGGGSRRWHRRNQSD